MSNAISEKWCDGSIGIYCLAGHHFHNPQVNKNRCRSSRFGHNESRHVQPADLACGLLRLFGATGNCAACSKLIPAFEMVMRVRESVYHLDCFACQLCSQRFCVGDKFFLKNNMILCQSDYEETSAKETFPSPVPT